PPFRMRSTVIESSIQPARGRILFTLIALFSFGGTIVSAISLERHYAKSATAYCDFGPRFNCDIVNRSEYSEIAGIPVAGIGVVGYATLLALSTYWRSRDETIVRLLIVSLIGLAFALYLTYLEAYKLETWCILCLSSLALIAGIATLSVILKAQASPLGS